jgi:hypothetical protein
MLNVLDKQEALFVRPKLLGSLSPTLRDLLSHCAIFQRLSASSQSQGVELLCPVIGREGCESSSLLHSTASGHPFIHNQMLPGSPQGPPPRSRPLSVACPRNSPPIPTNLAQLRIPCCSVVVQPTSAHYRSWLSVIRLSRPLPRVAKPRHRLLLTSLNSWF